MLQALTICLPLTRLKMISVKVDEETAGIRFERRLPFQDCFW